MEYIDADRLKEEFQKRFDICKRVSDDDRNALDTQDWYRGKYTAYSECLSFIGSLQREQPEVDLEEWIEDFIGEEYRRYSEYEGYYVAEKDWRDSVRRAARHFYNLGLNAKSK